MEPDPDPPGAEIICVSVAGSGSENSIRDGSELIVEIIMCPSLELALKINHTFGKVSNFFSINVVKNEFLEHGSIGTS